MNILGIHDGQNPSAALVRDGVVVGFRYEARHRRSLAAAGFPRRAVLRLLADAGITPQQVDAVAFAGHTMQSPRTLRDYLSQFGEESSVRDYAKTALKYVIPGAFRTDLRKKDRLQNLARSGFEASRGSFVDAHLAASMLAYGSGAGFSRRCLVLCAATGADRLGATVHVAQNGRLERIASVHEEDSLGALMEHLTYMLGMAPQRDEPLLMELGARASGPGVRSAAKRFELLFGFDEHLPLNWHRASHMPDTSRCQEFLRKHFRRRRFDHIAGGWYRFVSEFVAAWVGRCAHKTEIRDILVCGDVFELSDLLPVASRHRSVVSLDVSPLPGPAGNSIGAAMLLASEREEGGAKALKPVRHPYLGQDATPETCKAAIDGYQFGDDVVVERPDDLPRRVASLIAAGAVLARFAGREDVRLRGLGNRSLIARSDHPQAHEKLHELAHTDCFWASPRFLWQSERLRTSFLEADTLPEAACGEYSLTPRHASPFHHMPRGARVPVQAVSRSANPALWDIMDACSKAVGRAPLLTEVWRQPDGHMVKDARTAVMLWRDQGLSGVILGEWLVYRSDLAVTPTMAAGTRGYLGGDED